MFRDAQEKIAATYPDDDEAQIAYAITLNTSADLNDKTYAQQLKGAAILEPISKRLPRHPGVTHYLIHLYDYPALAAKGLEAADRYAGVAPAAPHAQHMPSHIYTRVGYWKQSIDSNAASVKAAKAEKSVGNYLHAQDYMVYAHLQLGQDKQASAVMDDMMKETDFKASVMAAHYALAAAPARYAVERGTGRARRSFRSAKAPLASSRQSHTMPGHSGLPAPVSQTLLQPISPSLPSFATSSGRARTIIGPRSSKSNVKSLLPGCCTHKANTMKHSTP